MHPIWEVTCGAERDTTDMHQAVCVRQARWGQEAPAANHTAQPMPFGKLAHVQILLVQTPPPPLGPLHIHCNWC